MVYDSRNYIQDSTIDLSPLKRLADLIPNSCDLSNKCILDTIDSLSIACFHAALSMRTIQDPPLPPEPKGNRSDILDILGLSQPISQKIERRI